MHPPVAHLLVVVEDDDGLRVQPGEVVGQGRAQVGGGDHAGEAQQAQRLPAGGGEAGPQRGHEVGGERPRVVAGVQGDPGRRRPGGQPLAQQGGLAGPGRAAEQHQRRVRPAVEEGEQPGAGDGVRGQAGLQQLAPPQDTAPLRVGGAPARPAPPWGALR